MKKTFVFSLIFVLLPITTSCGQENNKYTVTFDTDGGTPVPPTQEVFHGKCVTKPEDPVKHCEEEGKEYKFYCWSNDGGVSSYNFDTPVTSNLTLKAFYNKEDSRKDTVILYTNDPHGEVANTLSFKNIAKLKKDLIKQNNNVLLFDSGDDISGGLYTTEDKGLSMINIMNETGYDAATLGNHEFDYKLDYLKDSIIKNAKFPYISTNFYNMKDGKATTRFTDLGSKVFKFDGISIGVIGVSTPESVSTSTPSFFKDKDGNFIYTFSDDNLYDIVQSEIDSIRPNCDYVICLSHLGDEDKKAKFSATNLAKNTSGIDFIFDGHSHIHNTNKVVKDKNNKGVTITQAGGKFKTIGKLTITKDRKINSEFIDYMDEYDEDVYKLEKKVIDDFDKKFNIKIATSDINFTRPDYGEYALGDIVAESPYYYYNEIDPTYKGTIDVSFTNTGGVRSDVKAGDWTFRTCNEIHTFANPMCVKEISGKTIKTALEFSTRKCPNYFGGFQQLCGIKCNVKTTVQSDIVVDGNGAYVSGPSKDHERVSNIEIYDKTQNKFVALDETKTYRVAGSAYVLNECGDGCSMFKEGKLLQIDYEICDYVMLAKYVSSFTKAGDYAKISAENSPLKKYSNLYINYDDATGASKRVNKIT